MALAFKKIGIIGTHMQSCVAETVSSIINILQPLADIYVEHKTESSLDYRSDKSYSLDQIANICDVAIVVGGDGNFLNAARSLSQIKSIPIIGVNRGKLGFLTDVMPSEIDDVLLSMLHGKYRQESRGMIEAFISNTESLDKSKVALNEIMISAGENIHLFEIKVYINNCHAFDQRADGLIIATPTGSTAHALSAGGPIMYPSLDVVELVPMFSHTLNARPIILDANDKIDIVIAEYNNPKPVVSFDGEALYKLKVGDTLTLHKSKYCVNVLHPIDHSFYSSLRSKLNWSKMLF